MILIAPKLQLKIGFVPITILQIKFSTMDFCIVSEYCVKLKEYTVNSMLLYIMCFVV